MIRKIFVSVLTVLTYIATVYMLFFQSSILRGIGIGLILFVVRHFFALETKDKQWYHFFLLLGGGAGLIIVFGNIYNILGLASVLLFHIALYLLIYTIHYQIANSKKISLWEIVHLGAYVFSVLMTVAYSLWSMHITADRTMTCDQLYTTVDTVTDQITKPLRISLDTIDKWKNSIMGTSEMTVGEVIGLPPSLSGSIATPLSPVHTEDLNFGEQLLRFGKETKDGVLGQIDIRTQKGIDTIMSYGKNVNKKICVVIMDAIHAGFNNQIFQYSIVFLMFILLSPFVRIVIYLCEIITRLLLQILFITKIYKIGYKKSLVEEII